LQKIVFNFFRHWIHIGPPFSPYEPILPHFPKNIGNGIFGGLLKTVRRFWKVYLLSVDKTDHLISN